MILACMLKDKGANKSISAASASSINNILVLSGTQCCGMPFGAAEFMDCSLCRFTAY